MIKIIWTFFASLKINKFSGSCLEHLYDSGEQTADDRTKTITKEKNSNKSLNFEESRKVNYYHPSATWHTPTVVYEDDRVVHQMDASTKSSNNKSLNKSNAHQLRFGMRRKPITNRLRIDHSIGKSLPGQKSPTFKSTKISNDAMEKQSSNQFSQLPVGIKHQSPIVVAHSNQTKPLNPIKTKEKGIKIITEFELIHKGRLNNNESTYKYEFF